MICFTVCPLAFTLNSARREDKVVGIVQGWQGRRHTDKKKEKSKASGLGLPTVKSLAMHVPGHKLVCVCVCDCTLLIPGV